MNQVAVHESENSEKVVKFINQDLLNKEVNDLIENGNLYGIYFDEDVKMVAKDIWGEIHKNIEESIIMKTLNTTNVNNLIGKIIKWQAPADSANAPYKGVAKIESVASKTFKATIISGDDLNYAFLDKMSDGTILSNDYCYSDSDRAITFEEIND